ncbi:MAG: hypothetical protein HXY28_10055 [Hydrogenophilaceae bacterium]|jgi:hypothetical protein|nr:hypothetical protein [Hydrogenophilaceae bacterium]
MTRILVAHAPAAQKRAALVIEALAALGYRIEAAPVTALAPHKRRKLEGAVAQAGAVVVLWSKHAAEAPALRATADRARAAGKLALARLDAAAPPLGLSAFDLSRWGGYRDAKAWKRLLAALPKAPAAHAGAVRERGQAAAAGAGANAKKKGGALAWLALVVMLLAAAGAGAYFAWSAGLIG